MKSEELETIQDFLDNQTSEVTVISPYISADVLEAVTENLETNDVTVIVRWSPGDFVTGSADTKLYDLCESMDWKLLRNSDIHLKLIVKNSQEVWWGSSNITRNGILDGDNIELTEITDLDETKRLSLKKSIEGSTIVNKSWKGRIEDWIPDQKNNTSSEFPSKLENTSSAEVENIKNEDRENISEIIFDNLSTEYQSFGAIVEQVHQYYPESSRVDVKNKVSDVLDLLDGGYEFLKYEETSQSLLVKIS